MRAQRPANDRKVSITYDPASKRLAIHPKIAVLNLGRRQELLWRCGSANLEILFSPEETPFRASRWRCSRGGGCKSGVPNRRRERLLKYTVRVLDSLNGHAAPNGPVSEEDKTGHSPAETQDAVAAVVKEAFLVLL
jgi:hypothetical protein